MKIFTSSDDDDHEQQMRQSSIDLFLIIMCKVNAAKLHNTILSFTAIHEHCLTLS